MARTRGLVLLVAALSCALAGATGHYDVFGDEYFDDLLNSTNALGNSSNPEELLRCTELQLVYKKAPATNHCAPYFDKVLCWEHQPAGTLASQTCFAELNGVPYDNNGRNATRMCHANATWEATTNYSACLKDLASASDPGNLHTELTSTIYYVGYTVSTVVLTVAVFVFSHFSELHCLRNRIHMNLMLAYIGADIVWILNMTVNVYLGHESTEFCIIFTVLLQYTLLTHFLWMFVEGLYLFTLVVMTFQQHSAKLPVYLVIGWGTPLVAVLAWVITRLVHPPDQGEREGTCPWWQEHWADRIWIQAPCILVLVVNSIFLVFIMYVLITKLRSEGSMRPGRGRGHDHSSAEQQQSAKAAKALLVLIPLLGITYILVIYGPTTGNAAQAFDLARALLLSTQGLLVALFYCFLNTDVRHTVGHRWERWREMRTVGRQRNGRAASVNWTTRDTETCIMEHRSAAKPAASFQNGHKQQPPQPQRQRQRLVTWLDNRQAVGPSLGPVEAHM